MEVRDGYAQSAVGLIPGDWACKPLADFLSFISYGFTNPMPTVADGVYMITAADIDHGKLQLASARKTSISSFQKLLTAKSKPRVNDVLLTKDGSLGRLALVGEETICINQSVAVLRANEKVEPNFLKLLLESPWYQTRMLEDAGGSTIKHIYITIVDKMPIGLPLDKAEQRAIATALSDVDALIAGLEKLIAKKRDLKQAAMQQLLTGQTRLPGFSGEWEPRQLGQLGTFLKGSGVKRDEALSGELPCVRYGEIYTVHSDVVRTFHSRISPQVAAIATRIQKGDLLFAGSGETKAEIGKCVAMALPMEAYAGGDIVILRLRSGNPSFFGYLLNTPAVVRQKSNLGQGDAVVHISALALSSIEVEVPSIEEQTAIATVLSDMDLALSELKGRLAKTRELKQGMMQVLLTGRTRLV
jgi:type I restriction enzyme S subunit